jgi:uncharacterized membrane protein YfcA
MQTMDLLNACFEAGGSIFILNHARVLLKDKMTKGVSLLSVLFFSCWGIFNMFYYSHLGQNFSWYAGIMVFISNSIYASLIIYFRIKEKDYGKHSGKKCVSA